MADKFDDNLFDDDNFYEEPEETSQLEAVVEGTGQGLTMGFLDEIKAAFKADPAMGRLQSYTAPIKDVVQSEKDSMQSYEKELESLRSKSRQLREDNPYIYGGSEIVGGILPAIFTGGGAAAARTAGAVGKESGKQLLKTAIKEGGKTGAKYGAVAGLGYSEADTPLDLTKDAIKGSATGALAGAAFPIAGEGVKRTASKAKAIGENIVDLVPQSEAIKSAFKYGRQGKSLDQNVVDDELVTMAKVILERIKDKKKSNSLKDLTKELDDMGIRVDGTKEAIDQTISDLERIAGEDLLGMQNKQLLPKLKALAGQSDQESILLEKSEKNAIKKILESQGKKQEAVIKAEKELAKKNLKSKKELETISDINESMDNMEIPFDTSDGVISGAKGKFKYTDKDGNVKTTTETILNDATEYQPKIESKVGPDGRPIVTTTDLGSGKVSALVGKVEEKVKDISILSVGEVEDLRRQLNQATKLAKGQGSTDDPVILRAGQLAQELRKLTDEAVAKYGDDVLADRRRLFSDMMGAEDLLGLSRRFDVRNDLNLEGKADQLASKLGFDQGFKGRQEVSRATQLLGEDIIPSSEQAQFELIRKVNQLTGRSEIGEGISSSGLYKTAVGTLPNLAGRATKKATDLVSKAASPVGNTINKLSEMTRQQLESLGSTMSQLNPEIGARLMEAASMEGLAKNQAMWALSQNPAVRNFIEKNIGEFEKDMKDDLGIVFEDMDDDLFDDDNLYDEESATIPFRSKNEESINREPSGLPILDTIAEGEGGYDSMNQGTVNGRIYGSTDNAKNKLGKPLTQHTIGEIRELQSRVKTDRDNSAFAVGKYQIIPQTMDYLIKTMNITDDQMFDEELQEKMGQTLLEKKRPTAYKYLTGESDDIEGAAKALSKEWASLPNPETGNSYYGQGNKAQHSVEEIYEKLRKSREQIMEQIDRVNQQQSSGDDVPINQLDALLEKISFADGQRLKELLQKVTNLS